MKHQFLLNVFGITLTYNLVYSGYIFQTPIVYKRIGDANSYVYRKDGDAPGQMVHYNSGNYYRHVPVKYVIKTNKNSASIPPFIIRPPEIGISEHTGLSSSPNGYTIRNYPHAIAYTQGPVRSLPIVYHPPKSVQNYKTKYDDGSDDSQYHEDSRDIEQPYDFVMPEYPSEESQSEEHEIETKKKYNARYLEDDNNKPLPVRPHALPIIVPQDKHESSEESKSLPEQHVESMKIKPHVTQVTDTHQTRTKIDGTATEAVLHPLLIHANNHLAPAQGHSENHLKETSNQYNQEKYSKKGHKTSKGHKSEEKYSKGKKGKHDEENHIKSDKGEGEESNKYHKDEHAHGAFEEEGDSSKKGEFGEKKKHRKGSKTEGYHNVFHKDEFVKDHTFYDQADHTGHFRKHEKYHKSHHRDENDHKEKKHLQAGHAKANKAHNGKYKKGHHDLDQSGYDNKNSHDKHHQNGQNYLKKGHSNHHHHHGYQKS